MTSPSSTRRPMYQKPWLSYADQVGQLASRGVVIDDLAAAEAFLAHINYYRSTYAQFPDLPIWMAMEVTSFGALSKMYKGMLRPDQRTIARRYGLQAADLVTILHHLVYIRNLCAHPSRLWDRLWAIKPSLPKARAWQPPHVTTLSTLTQ